MALVELKGLYRTVQGGRVYFYAWRRGPRMKADPADSVAFAEEFARHHADRKGGDKSKISGLIVEWKASDAWTKPPPQGLADSTRRNWGPLLDKVADHFGTLSIAQFDRPQIRPLIRRWRDNWKATPRAADMAKQVLSALLSFAVEEGKLGSNPCFGIPNLYKSDRSEIIWTDDDVARLIISGASREVVWALELATLTGLRQGDLLKLSWSHVGELAIEMRTGKSGQQRSALIPIHAELRDLLAEIPKRSTRVLTNADGQPWRTGFSSSWNKAMQRMGEDVLHFHDARGSFATKAYVAGFSIREIAELLAWSEDQVERIINRYVRRDALLQDRIRRLDEARKQESRP
jgi:integrase